MSTILTPPGPDFFVEGDRFENNLGRTLTVVLVDDETGVIDYIYDADEFYPDPQPGTRRCASTIGWRKL